MLTVEDFVCASSVESLDDTRLESGSDAIGVATALLMSPELPAGV